MSYDFSKYIGLKYKHLGRDFSGVDCFGIVWLIFKGERDITLPDFTTLNYSDALTYKSFTKVKPPYKPFDCPIFLDGHTMTFANHIGVFITGDSFIHIEENTTSMISRLDDYYKSKLYIVIRID
uniref:Putative tail protein n=1 Tax=viral metagenome TaxID=1070528 RepID=A0A6M3LB33_9ZZZZ